MGEVGSWRAGASARAGIAVRTRASTAPLARPASRLPAFRFAIANPIGRSEAWLYRLPAAARSPNIAPPRIPWEIRPVTVDPGRSAMYRVIQWATGNVGRAAIRGILAHPELELAGVYVHGADKEGRDAGELAGVPSTGVRATRDAAALLATKADCVLYSPLLAKPDEVKRLVASGKNVVTPLGWFYPGASAAAAELHAACVAAGVTLHGTGIHPGGITERF